MVPYTRGGLLNLLRIGDVDLQDQRAPTQGFHLGSRPFQTGLTAREQCDRCAVFCKLACCCTPDTRRGAGDNNSFLSFCHT